MGQKYAAYSTSGSISGFYDSVDSPVPSGITAIEITEAQWQAALASQYPVSVENGELVIPTGPTLAQAQSAQTALVTKGYNTATDYVPVTINGTTYQVDNTPGKQALNLGLVITANAMLQAPAWVADTNYSAGAYCSVGGVILFCSTPGKSGTSAPTPPTAFGTPVTDGTAAWELAGRYIDLKDNKHLFLTPQQILDVAIQIDQFTHTQKTKLVSILAKIDEAKTLDDVKLLSWENQK